MAMLAEPRRKQKFSVNPQGTSWSNDESKFGQKMLERMGWSKGKGLGAKEDGRVDHVSISLKNDQKGVGCSKSYSDNWIAHQDDFNSLLESLNQDHGEERDNSSSMPDQVTSLERKSQSSRNRVHYSKFTRGKDLSSRSNHDLKCIFGKRASKETSGENTPTLESAELSASEDSNTEVSHGFTTIKSTSNLQEYFAKKMAALKGQKVVNSDVENCEKTTEQGSVIDGEEKRDRKKKKKKSKRKTENTDAECDKNVVKSIDSDVVGNIETHEQVEDSVAEKQEGKRKKKKKLKGNKEGEVNTVALEVDTQVRENEGRKHKSKKRRKGGEEVMAESRELVSDTEPPKKKKKKKEASVQTRSGEGGDITQSPNSVMVKTEVKPTPSKKKQRNRTSDLPQVIQTVCKSFKGANVASIRGYDKTSMCEKEMLKKIQDRHRLVLRTRKS